PLPIWYPGCHTENAAAHCPRRCPPARRSDSSAHSERYRLPALIAAYLLASAFQVSCIFWGFKLLQAMNNQLPVKRFPDANRQHHAHAIQLTMVTSVVVIGTHELQ